MSDRYTLHFGLADGAGPALLHSAVSVHTALAGGEPVAGGIVRTVHADGDSFLEWGEYHTRGGLHGQVEFDAEDGSTAVQFGEVLYEGLVAAGVANPDASCWPGDDKHVPWHVSTTEDWSVPAVED